MSEQLGIGKLITTPQTRDAIHVAVVPVTARNRLFPGQRVGIFRYEGTLYANFGAGYHGIIDPYLAVPVEAGQRCWVHLIPGSVSSLRHAWTHNEIPDEEPADGK